MLSHEHILGFDTETLKAAKTRRLYEYWNLKRGDRPRPQLSDIDLMEIYDIAPCVVVRDVIDNGTDLRCRYWGTELTKMFGADCSGKLISESWTSLGSKNTLDLYINALATDMPTRYLGNLGYAEEQRQFISFEAVMLGLDSPHAPKQHAIGAFDFGYEMDDEDREVCSRLKHADA